MAIFATRLDPSRPDWVQQIDQIRHTLSKTHSQYLMAEHFDKVVLPKIGGHVCLYWSGEHHEDGQVFGEKGDQAPLGYGFLYPRGVESTSAGLDLPSFTLRFMRRTAHPLAAAASPSALVHATEALFPSSPIYFYDPTQPHTQPHTYVTGHHPIGGLDFGCPDRDEAVAVRLLQRQIWGNPDHLLYPSDIHSVEFSLATTLIARDKEEIAGFLYGFYKFRSNPPLPAQWQGRINDRLRIESQTMGVSPYDRGRNIGTLLKLLQAARARAEGIDIVNWTVDPLQFPNAALNFSKLRAVAYSFQANFYDIQNDLNRVGASRFSLTWLVNSGRVREVRAETPAQIVQVGHRPEIVRINRGVEQIAEPNGADVIAIEIPADWTRLQAQEPEAAQRWRLATDRILGAYVGTGAGHYVITAAGVEASRRFLIGERATESLLERLILA